MNDRNDIERQTALRSASDEELGAALAARGITFTDDQIRVAREIAGLSAAAARTVHGLLFGFVHGLVEDGIADKLVAQGLSGLELVDAMDAELAARGVYAAMDAEQGRA